MKPTKPARKPPGDRVTACNLAMSMAVTLAPQSILAFDRTWIALPPTANWSLPANWGGTAPLANDSVLFGTSGTVLLTNDLAANHVLNGITFNAGGSAFIFGGNAINLNGPITNGGANPQNIGFPVGLQATTVTVSGAANVTIAGKITSGILGGVVGANRTLTNSLTAGTLTLGAIDLSIDPDGAVRTLTLAGAGNTAITGAVANGSTALTANNKLTYTGSGTLTFNGTTGSTYTGSTTINSGTLALDFSNMPIPTNLLGLSNLTFGSSVVVKGKSSAATLQTFNGITSNANRSSTFTVNQNGATTVDITLGGMTRGAQSTTNFVLPATGTVTTSSASTVNGLATTAGSIAYLTSGGNTWLAKSGAGPFTLSAYPEGSYSTSYVAASNVNVTGGDTPAAGSTVSSLRFSGAPGKVLTLDGVNTVSTGGILVTSAATGSIITGGTLRGNPNAGSRELLLIDHGSLEVSSTIADNGTGTALTVTGSGTTTLSGNNTFTGAVSINQGITKIGVFQSGVASSALGIGNAGAPAVTIAPGATLDLNGFDQTVGAIGTAEGTIRNNSGFPSALTVKNNGIQNGVIVTGADLNLISDVGSGNQYQINASLNTFGGTLTQRSGTLRTNTFQTDFGTALIVLDVSAAGAIGTNGTLGGNNRFYLNSGTGSLPNNIQVDTAGFISQNSAARTLSGNITGTGVLNIIDGNDTLSGDNSLFEGTFNLWSSGTGIFINSTTASSAGAKYTFSTEGTPSGTSAYAANIPGGGTVHMGELSTTGATSNSRIRNNVNNTTATFSVGDLGTDSTFGGVIANGTGTNQVTALTKVGIGTLTLTGNSTHSGATAVNGGTLAILAPRSIAATSAVTVAAAGTIGGTGTFAGPVTAAGTIAPGTAGAGTLNVGATVLTGTLAVEVSGAVADKLVSTGNINITGATLTVTQPVAGTLASYVIAEGTSRTGTFATTNLPAGYSVAYNATQVLLNLAGGGGYDSWKILPANGLTAGVNDGVNDDPDLDGYNNLLEYALGGVPAGSGASTTPFRPVAERFPAVSPTSLRLTFRRADISEGDVTLKVQWSTNLTTWGAPDEVTIGALDAGIVDITEDSPSAALDTVAVSIPLTEALNGKLFARVIVTRP